MDAQTKDKWIKALRSGEYEQGDSFFEKDGRFCCLGVLCAVLGQPTALDPSAGHYSNFAAINGILADKDQHELMRRNDGYGGPRFSQPRQSFAEIADYIEQHL